MAIKPTIVKVIRKNSLRAFKMLSKGKGVSPCTFYPATSGTTQVVKRNLYHDVIEDTGPGKVDGVPTYTYIDMMPPLKTIREYGWWKEGDALPIVAYLPYEDTFVPEKGAKMLLEEGEGYMGGMYHIEHVKMYGQDVSVLWVVTITPDRDSKIRL